MQKYLLIAPSNYSKGKLENYKSYFNELVEIKFIPEQIVNLDVSKYKGLILIGGEDVNPNYYGEENFYSEVDDMRDKVEFEMIDKFLTYQKIIFGICRGIQVLNVFFKGSLYQDIPSNLNSYLHKPYDGKTPNGIEVYNGDTYHYLEIVNENPIFEKDSKFIVNSRHHQAIKKLANGFKAFAISEDGIIEAIFHNERPIFAVQWHPERIKPEYRISSERILNFLKKL